MREFSPKEKMLITKLSELYKPTGVTKVGDVLLEVHKIKCLKKIEPEEWEKSCDTIIDNRQVKVSYYENKEINFEAEFYESIALIEFLEQHRYLVLSSIFKTDIIGDDSNSLVLLGENRSNSLHIFNNFTNDLWRTFSSFYVVTNSLIDLKDHDFKSPEQRRFEQQLNDAESKHNDAMSKATKQVKLARNAFIMSIIGLIAAVTIPFIFNSTTIHEESLQRIESMIEQNKVQIPTTINTHVTNDTLKVNVVKQPAVLIKLQIPNPKNSYQP